MAFLLFFGRFSDLVEDHTLSLPENVTTTKALSEWLSETYAGFEAELERPGAQIAVNKHIIQSHTPIFDGDEIAYMSALSGG